MKKGDFIIWNSGFGYDVGYYVKDKGVMYGTCEVYLLTGVSEGRIPVAPYEVEKFNCQSINALNRKYRYDFESRTYINLLSLLNKRKENFDETT